ncbi:MAG TPA: hypothetical protein VEI98_02975 [Xanthobacteraceae bacterium]|nr:hypothetical protein [Xanthobacteraceae bacterium]
MIDFASARTEFLAREFMSRGPAGSANMDALSWRAANRERAMPIDLSTVNWTYVALMAAFAFVAALIGSVLSFRNRVGGALLAAILFAAMYVMWNYYPHPQIQLPIVTTYSYPSSG